MNKKIVFIICALIILTGIIMTFTMGFNVGLQYKESNRIQIAIGKEIDKNELKQIAKEVFQTNNVIVEAGDEFQDTFIITVENKNTDQINELIKKTNETYAIQNEIADLVIVHVPAYRIRDIIKPYTVPFAIAVICVTAYFMIIYRKKSIIKMLTIYLLGSLIIELLYFSIIAITRIPMSYLIFPISIFILILYTVFATYKISILPDRMLKKMNKK